MAVTLTPIETADAWDRRLRGVGYAPWQQSWAYGAALAHRGHPLARFAFEVDGQPLGLVQAIGRLAGGGRIGLWHALGGPLWRAGTPATLQAEALGALRRRLAGPARGLIVTPAATTARVGAGLAAGGWRRVVTGYTTALLPITSTPARRAQRLAPAWRRELTRGNGGLALAWRDARADPLALDRALLRHEAARARRRFAVAPPAVVVEAARRGPTLLATATGADGLEAFMLFFRHGAAATYQLGWTSPAGRAARAHHRLLWGALPRLRADGVRLVDLGGLNVPDGIVRFKLATGAHPRSFAGSFV